MNLHTELDEILEDHKDYYRHEFDYAWLASNGEFDSKQAKQAILDLHNKQVEEVLDRIKNTWQSDLKLRHTPMTDGEEALLSAIEAERNKLKEGSDD